jgi:crossover junction endodeoxyribonuclease RuvC
MRILGIDPGIATLGYAVIQKNGPNLTAIECGAITTPTHMHTPQRLRILYENLTELLERLQPDELATERLFFAKNETTAFSVGRAIGVVLLAAAQRSLPWTEYTPPQIKQAVTGYGSADKKQVQYMVQRILSLTSPPKPDDAADAAAVAICHAHTAWAHRLNPQ